MKLKLDYQAGGWFINGCRASKSMALVNGEWFVFDGLEQTDEGEILVQLLDRDGGDLTAPIGTIDDIQEI